MREGIKSLKDELVVPRFCDEEEQSKCDATAEEYLLAELGDKLMQIAKDCVLSIKLKGKLELKYIIALLRFVKIVPYLWNLALMAEYAQKIMKKYIF